ncbi:hypothetical protein [Bacillus pumilus]|nr:hypothetical protein [Bacillus pumilus]
MDKLTADALLDVLAKSLNEWNKINKKNGDNKNGNHGIYKKS